MAVVTMRQLLEAGIHFGHQTRRWHPKMSRYIFGQRNGIYIIDLQHTLRQLLRAYKLVLDTVAEGGVVLFVGTKKQAQEAVKREAERCGMYYVNNRWLGGTLTNWQTIRGSIRTLVKLTDLEQRGLLAQYGKKEASMLGKQRQRLEKNLCGIKDMPRRPDVIFVVDAKNEAIAVREARRLRIPCIAVVDTNTDPDEVDLPIPGNDDAIRAINLFCEMIANAALEGRMQGEKLREQRAKDAAEEERTRMARAEGATPDKAAPFEEAPDAAEAEVTGEAAGDGEEIEDDAEAEVAERFQE